MSYYANKFELFYHKSIILSTVLRCSDLSYPVSFLDSLKAVSQQQEQSKYQ